MGDFGEGLLKTSGIKPGAKKLSVSVKGDWKTSAAAFGAVLGKATGLQRLEISNVGKVVLDLRADVEQLDQYSGKELGPPAAAFIAAALNPFMRNLQFLDLSNNDLKAEGIEALSGGLAANKTLTHLSLTNNDIKAAGGRAIAKALKANTTLETVSIDTFELPIKQLKGTKPVETLDLSRKELTNPSAIVISRLIENNLVLTSLN
eukprot:2679676-Prymnesium_polylepis.1